MSYWLSQIERCSEILKKLTLNPIIEDDFIDRDLTIHDYINEIVKSFQEISNKEFIVNCDQNLISINITKSIEISLWIKKLSLEMQINLQIKKYL